MLLLGIIVFIEESGMFLALDAMTGRKVDAVDVNRGLCADSLECVEGFGDVCHGRAGDWADLFVGGSHGHG
jgi:hypothetical protein